MDDFANSLVVSLAKSGYQVTLKHEYRVSEGMFVWRVKVEGGKDAQGMLWAWRHFVPDSKEVHEVNLEWKRHFPESVVSARDAVAELQRLMVQADDKFGKDCKVEVDVSQKWNYSVGLGRP